MSVHQQTPLRAAAARVALRVALRVARAARVLRAIVGAPDYEAYVAHLRERRPNETPLCRDEFAAARLRARYERPGSRCC